MSAVPSLTAEEATRRAMELLDDPLAIFTPTPGFAGFMCDPHRWLLLRAANQVGKSFHVAARLARIARSRPGLRIRITGPGKEMVRQVLQRYVYEFLRHDLAKDNYQPGRGFSTNTISLRNGTIIQFRSYEDNPQSAAGDQLNISWLDEVPKRSHYLESVARVTRLQGCVWVTCTPVDRPVDWFRDIVEPMDETTGERRAWIAGQERPDGTQWCQYVVPFERENVPWLSDEQFHEQHAIMSADPTQSAQRLYGAWEGASGDRLYTGFGPDCVQASEPFDRRLVTPVVFGLGIDHGELAGNQVALLVGWQGNQLWVIDEYVAPAAESYEEDAFAIEEMVTRNGLGMAGLNRVIGDINVTKGGQSVNRKLEQAFRSNSGGRLPFRVESPNKGRGSVDWGQRLINYALVRGDLVVHPRCRRLVDALNHYQGTGTPTDKALSHALDALRYIVTHVLGDRLEYQDVRFG